MVEKKYQKSDDIVFRKIADEMILVPIRQRMGDLQNIYTLNEVAGRIWELLDGQRTLTRIKDNIVFEFEISPEQAEKDMQEFLEKLKNAGAVKEI